MLKIDAHQHFWKFDPVRDNWITTDMINIRRDFLPIDLEPIHEQHSIYGCVAVQADQSPAETTFLLNLAHDHSFIKAVVGWVDLCAPNINYLLDEYSDNSKLKGFRHIVQAEKPGFMLNPGFQRGIAALTAYGYTYDILVRHSQLHEATALAEMNPDQAFVLDHLGKPDIRHKNKAQWKTELKKIAVNENVFCKLSGMITEADLNTWTKEDIYPFMDIALEAFGTKRLMFGSDWPVCKLAGEYERVLDVVESYTNRLSILEQEDIWSDTARRFYKL